MIRMINIPSPPPKKTPNFQNKIVAEYLQLIGTWGRREGEGVPGSQERLIPTKTNPHNWPHPPIPVKDFMLQIRS